jgi:hypothetical protein
MYARSLSRLSLVFVALYVLLVVSSAIPAKLLDYEWLNRVTATLINGSSMPLLALLVLVVGNLLYPENQLLDKRRKLFSGFAVVAVYGFLLLIPLHIFTGLLLQTTNSDQFRALDKAERQLDSYRQAANQATSVSELQARLTKLSAPGLNPEILARPLPEVKVQVSAAFNQVAAQIAQQRQALTAENSWSSRGPQVLRIVMACLVLAFGFAAFAQPTPSAPLLIDSIEQKLGHFSRRSLFRKSEAPSVFAKSTLKQPFWLRRLFSSRPPKPPKNLKAKGSSARKELDYIDAVLSKDSRDS